jgi:hypothetical protein
LFCYLLLPSFHSSFLSFVPSIHVLLFRYLLLHFIHSLLVCYLLLPPLLFFFRPSSSLHCYSFLLSLILGISVVSFYHISFSFYFIIHFLILSVY